MAQSLYGFDPEEKDRQRSLREVELTPAQQRDLRVRQSQRGFERGIEKLGAAAFGQMTEDQHKQAAMQEIKQLSETVTPGTPEFYEKAADIFKKHGLTAHAETMIARLREIENVKHTGESDVMKLQRTIDALQKRFDAGETSVKPALDKAKELLANMKAKGTSTGSESVQSEAQRRHSEALAKFEKDPSEANRKEVDFWKGRMQMLASRDPTSAERLKQDKEEFGYKKERDEQEDKGKDVATARAAGSVLSAIYKKLNSAEQLLSHSGLDSILGKWNGAFWDTVVAMKSDDAAGAMSLWQNVIAQTFLQALSNLKKQSPTGASGLGQLTEREGDKIQNAEAALQRQQPTGQFVSILKQYISALNEEAAVFSSVLQKSSALTGVNPPQRPAMIKSGPNASIYDVEDREPARSRRAPAAEKPSGKRSYKLRELK